jgi:quercetin dioxygenase-like cupin family protein
MEAAKDASRFYEVERRTEHATRPGFRITELQISRSQKVPWHYHSNVQDTFYVLGGCVRIFLREPEEEARLGPGETYTVQARRPHLAGHWRLRLRPVCLATLILQRYGVALAVTRVHAPTDRV